MRGQRWKNNRDSEALLLALVPLDIDKNPLWHDPRWQTIDAATFASNNLYNAAQYLKRQAYIHEGHRIIMYSDLDKLMQPTNQYKALPAKVAQWVLKQVCVAWDSYFAAVAEWTKHPEKFLGHPKLPKYLDKDGRNLLVYTA